MKNLVKIVTGVILLYFSIMYLQVIDWMISEGSIDAVLQVRPNIQVEFVESEYLGQNPILYGQREQAEEGYSFYKLTYHIENLGSRAAGGKLDEIIDINTYTAVRRVVQPPGREETKDFTGLYPVLPGKTSADVVYYLEVEDDVGRIRTSFGTNTFDIFLLPWPFQKIELKGGTLLRA